MHKPTCEIEYWCIHEIVLNEAQIAMVEDLSPGVLPMMVTGMIVRDEAGRAPPETCLRSSPAVRHIPGELVETKNTRYRLKGPGRTSNTPPYDYAEEVGRTMMILSGKAELIGDDLTLTDIDASVL